MKKPERPPRIRELFLELGPERIDAIFFENRIGAAPGGRYHHWEQLRRRPPPEGLTPEEWWLGVKFARAQGRKELPLTDTAGQEFSYVLTDEAQHLLWQIDQKAAGRISMPEDVVSAGDRNRYAVSGLMEEAIASSLLEGAATTRREAKLLLRSDRAPLTDAERMVVNNYRTMQHISSDSAVPLTVEKVTEIHRVVTEDTLERPEDAGRIQQPGEKRVDVGHYSEADLVYHTPPPAEELPARLESMVSFANGAGRPDPFVHPVVRAVALHFYLAYLHPFTDGNGRTARALFYRSLLRQGYWLAEYISISRLLKQAPRQYGQAFLHVETDEADFTYFLLHQLDVLDRAVEDLGKYLEAKAAEVHKAERALRRHPGVNHRQLAVLGRALRRPDDVYTIRSHQNTFGVTYPTAHRDLVELHEKGLLERHRAGREHRFFPAAEQIEQLLDPG